MFFDQSKSIFRNIFIDYEHNIIYNKLTRKRNLS